jgi:hypothetical protein
VAGAVRFAGVALTATGDRPLDHPTPDRPRRLYFALTNRCNRACPWCSTCSSPRGRTFLSIEKFRSLLPAEGVFQVQLEGGEPTIHPEFCEIAAIARAHAGCQRLVVCTNGVVLPRERVALERWLGRLGRPLTVKLSVNHYLLKRDAGLLELARTLQAMAAGARMELMLVVNVRLRRAVADDDAAVRAAVAAAGLLPDANVFYLQRYGFASEEPAWEAPRLVWDNFRLINPDGSVFGPDLIARSEGMRALP